MKRAYICIGGEGPSPGSFNEELTDEDMLIAADSGFDLAMELGLEPQLVVGDFDSIESSEKMKELSSCSIIRYERDKDYTDTELAIMEAQKRGVEECILIGGGGGRVDHLMALFALFERRGAPDRWYSSFGKAVCIKELRSFSLELGTMISFFPLGAGEVRPWSDGLKWELDGLRWNRGDYGISNVVVKKPFHVNLKEGKMLMIIPDVLDE